MASKFITRALLLCSSLTAASPIFKRAFPVPESATGDGAHGHVHDPSVIRRDDGTYFLFTTNDGINIATAPSMSGPWTHQGAALPNGSIINLPNNNDLWAPDVFKADDTYYLYYSVSDFGAQDQSDIGVATSTTLEPGSWTDHGSLGIPKDNRYNRIDPNLFRKTPDSPFLLTFGSFWDNIFQIPLTNPPLKISPDASASHLQLNSTKHNTEGPFLFRWGQGDAEHYYLFFSGGVCCNAASDLPAPGEEYRISVCRSKSPSGGFVDREGRDCVTENGGSLVYASQGDVYAPGGQGVFFDEGEGSVVLYYHYVKRSVGYAYEEFFFGWNRLSFEGGWPTVVGGGGGS